MARRSQKVTVAGSVKITGLGERTAQRLMDFLTLLEEAKRLPHIHCIAETRGDTGNTTLTITGDEP